MKEETPNSHALCICGQEYQDHEDNPLCRCERFAAAPERLPKPHKSLVKQREKMATALASRGVDAPCPGCAERGTRIESLERELLNAEIAHGRQGAAKVEAINRQHEAEKECARLKDISEEHVRLYEMNVLRVAKERDKANDTHAKWQEVARQVYLAWTESTPSSLEGLKTAIYSLHDLVEKKT